eukprot:scaffold681_cov173-Ochromonas_danica.AAC.29
MLGKGPLLNLFSWFSLFAPIALIFYTEDYLKILLAWVAFFLLVLFYPPYGLMMPHKYSDLPGNRS